MIWRITLQLLPLFLVLCIVPGIAALALMSVLAVRLRNKALSYYLVAFGCFSFSIAEILALFYLGINVSSEISIGVYALISLSIPFSLLMQAALPLAANELTQPPGKRWIDLGVVAVSALLLVAYCTPLVMSYSSDRRIITFGMLFPAVAVIEILFIGYSLGIIMIRRKAIADPGIRRLALALIGVTALFLPGIGYDQFYFSGIKFIDSVPVAVIFSPLFYMVLSILNLVFSIKALARLTVGAAIAGSPADSTAPASVHGIIESDRIASLAGRTGLSERETAIIPLIAQGLGNKQIADELGISPKTVGNHLFNIYRKLGVVSRFELLALLK
jgi:DNA-binding CsgD family transcriptional regulator